MYTCGTKYYDKKFKEDDSTQGKQNCIDFKKPVISVEGSE